MARFLLLCTISLFLALMDRALLRRNLRWAVIWGTLFVIEVLSVPFLVLYARTALGRTW